MEILENDILSIGLTPYAAALHQVWSKKLGRTLNLALASEEDHLSDPSYSGNTVGAYAGRIRDAVLTIGENGYHLSRNDGRNSLHGGSRSLRKLWDTVSHNKGHVLYETKLSHLEDGLPGNRRFRAGYLLRDNEIVITLYGESDRPTWLNLTNHVYWKLSERPELDERLLINASSVILNDDCFLPEKEVPVRCPVVLDTIPERLNNAFSLSGSVRIESQDVSVTMTTSSPYAVIYSGFYLPSPALSVEPQKRPLFSDTAPGTLSFSSTVSYRIDIRV